MKKGLLAAAVLIAGLQYFQQREGSLPASGPAQSAPYHARDDAFSTADDEIARVFSQRRSNVQVQAVGTVARVLADDAEGSRHQRFLLRLASGQSVLVAHNIDLAPRIEGLRQGDSVAFAGEYEWNERGGVIHWTHRDPSGRHAAGWLRHNGQVYQ